MQTKPFSIQSPESIAMEYGGNKQKIASATQMGLLDPTAAVLAGMFIDRMRSAAIQEQAPTSTVAQKVLGKAPPAPPAPPPAAAPAPGGLGSLPAAATPAPAPQAVPPMPAMADGGIVNIPIPDSMFDEPDNGGYNDGYAQGGIVAFGEGGATSFDPLWYLHAKVNPRGTFGLKRSYEVHKGDDFPVPVGTPVGAAWSGKVVDAGTSPTMGNYVKVQNPATGQVATYMHLSGLNVNPGDAVGAGQVVGKTGSTGRSTGPHLHFEVRNPNGSAVDPIAAVTGAQGWWGTHEINPALAASNTTTGGASTSQYPTAPGTMPKISAPDFLSLVNRYQTAVGANSPDTTQRQALMADLAKEISPEEVAKDKKRDMWMALAQMGIGMAASKSPHFLQAVAEGAQQAMPQVQASEKERKTEKRANQQAMLTLENMSNEDKQKAYALAVEMAKDQAGLLTDAQKLQLQAAIAQLDANTRMAVESISASVQKYNADTQAATSRYATDAGMTNNMIDNLFSLTNNITTNATRQNVAATKAGVTPGSNMLNTGAMPTGQTDPNAGYSYEPVQ